MRRQALNFDLDMKKVRTCYKNDSIAYYKIRNYLENNGFLHRQGSGYRRCPKIKVTIFNKASIT